MLVCFACYGGRLAALLENCTEWRVQALREGAAPARTLVPPRGGLADYPAALAALGVGLLVCGGLSRNWELFLRGNGLGLRAWVRGTPEALVRDWRAWQRAGKQAAAPARRVPASGPGAQRPTGLHI